MRQGNLSRQRPRSMWRRDAILDEAISLASAGGYEAVQMRTIADQAGIAVGTLYGYFPSKTHLLVSALTREFLRVEAMRDWSTIADDPPQRLAHLTQCLHAEWQRDPLLTEAMTRAFVVADTTAADEVDRATGVIARVLARALSGGEPSPNHLLIAGLLCDIWLANLTRFIGKRVSADEARNNIDRATRLILTSHSSPITVERYY
nr:TetR family transcriptional regulator [Mycobacterium sp. 1245111.1]